METLPASLTLADVEALHWLLGVVSDHGKLRRLKANGDEQVVLTRGFDPTTTGSPDCRDWEVRLYDTATYTESTLMLRSLSVLRQTGALAKA